MSSVSNLLYHHRLTWIIYVQGELFRLGLGAFSHFLMGGRRGYPSLVLPPFGYQSYPSITEGDVPGEGAVSLGFIDIASPYFDQLTANLLDVYCP